MTEIFADIPTKLTFGWVTSIFAFRCVIPTVFLSVILSALAGAGIFYLIYFFLVEFSKYLLIKSLKRGRGMFSQKISPESESWSNHQMTSGYCPWTRLPTGCYQYFQDSQNWTAAQALCRRRGGRLAELEGEEREPWTLASCLCHNANKTLCKPITSSQCFK